MMMVVLSIQNTGKGKIAEWAGWQGKGVLEDEHGNKFKPLDLRGWSCLPANDTLGGGWDGDSGSRIHPGETYRNALYHEYAPPTSKEVVITLPLDGRSLRFRGLIGSKEKLDHEQALEAKAGMVLEAGDLIRAIRDGSKDVKIDYPIGCTMRATGIVRWKSDHTKSRPDLKRIRSRAEGDKRTGIVGSGRWSVWARGVEWRAGRGEGLPSGAGYSCTDSRPTSGQHSVEGTIRAAVAQGAVERDGCTIKTGSRWSSFRGALQVTLANR